MELLFNTLVGKNTWNMKLRFMKVATSIQVKNVTFGYTTYDKHATEGLKTVAADMQTEGLKTSCDAHEN
jgi:hypothetical protein